MSVLSCLLDFLKSQDLSSLSSEEMREYENLLMNAITIELDYPEVHTYRVQLCSSAYVISDNILKLLAQNGFRVVHGTYHSYLEWEKFLTTRA